MKAIVQDTYGSADVLRLDDVDPPGWAPRTCSCGCAPPASMRASGT